MRPHHLSRIVNAALGTCALIEGEYIASTRLDGRLYVPGAFSRMT